MFAKTSRYYGIPTATYTTPGNRAVAYVLRRFVPDGTTAVVLAEHVVTQRERLDTITARYLGDPEQFWRVCDVNNAMQPEELTAESSIGRRLVIPLPQGG